MTYIDLSMQIHATIIDMVWWAVIYTLIMLCRKYRFRRRESTLVQRRKYGIYKTRIKSVS